MAKLAVGFDKSIGIGTIVLETDEFKSFYATFWLPIYFYLPLKISESKDGTSLCPWFLSLYTGGSFWPAKWGDLKNYYKIGISCVRSFDLIDGDPYGYWSVALNSGLMFVKTRDGKNGSAIFISIIIGGGSGIYK